MKSQITIAIILISVVMCISIYLINEVTITFPIFILVLLSNIISLLVCGLYVKKTIDKHFKI